MPLVILISLLRHIFINISFSLPLLIFDAISIFASFISLSFSFHLYFIFDIF